jgi:HSP20 family protein
MATSKITAEAPAGEVAELPRVDEAIAGVERLYQALTGTPPPPVEEPYAPIPVEKDAAEVVTERLDRLLDELGPRAGQPAPGTVAEPEWSPPLTVWENGEGLLLLVEVPGVQRHDLRLADEGDSLTIQGRRTERGDGMRLRMNERPLGPFRRRIILPRGAGGGNLSARLQDGVLEIRIPKPASAAKGPRAIPIS